MWAEHLTEVLETEIEELRRNILREKSRFRRATSENVKNSSLRRQYRKQFAINEMKEDLRTLELTANLSHRIFNPLVDMMVSKYRHLMPPINPGWMRGEKAEE